MEGVSELPVDPDSVIEFPLFFSTAQGLSEDSERRTRTERFP